LFGSHRETGGRQLLGDPFIEQGGDRALGDGDLEGVVDLAGVEVAELADVTGCL
jgi:hypothetical protein